MIAAELDALRADMAERGTRLLLVAAGDAASNRALLADLEVDLPVVLRAGADDDFVDPFPRMGTPAAYLLDADGRVAAPLVSGAYQVPTLARRAAGKVSPRPRRARPARYAPGASDGMCGAGRRDCGCGGGAKAAKPRTWTPTVAYRVGDYHLGIRADTPAAADVVRRFLAAHHVGDDPNVPANFSVVLGADGGGGGRRRPARDLKILLQGVGQRGPQPVVPAGLGRPGLVPGRLRPRRRAPTTSPAHPQPGPGRRRRGRPAARRRCGGRWSSSSPGSPASAPRSSTSRRPSSTPSAGSWWWPSPP